MEFSLHRHMPFLHQYKPLLSLKTRFLNDLGKARGRGGMPFRTSGSLMIVGDLAEQTWGVGDGRGTGLKMGYPLVNHAFLRRGQQMGLSCWCESGQDVSTEASLTGVGPSPPAPRIFPSLPVEQGPQPGTGWGTQEVHQAGTTVTGKGHHSYLKLRSSSSPIGGWGDGGALFRCWDGQPCPHPALTWGGCPHSLSGTLEKPGQAFGQPLSPLPMFG